MKLFDTNSGIRPFIVVDPSSATNRYSLARVLLLGVPFLG